MLRKCLGNAQKILKEKVRKCSEKDQKMFTKWSGNLFLGHGHSHGHGHVQRELTPEEREKARQKLHKNWDDDEDEFVADWSVYWCAIGSVAVISFFPFLILPCLPLDKTKENEWALKIALAFASGGLLGTKIGQKQLKTLHKTENFSVYKHFKE